MGRERRQMSRWEYLANEYSDSILDLEVERKQELEFKRQVIELSDEGICPKMIVMKLGIDLEIIEEILQERREYGKA